MVAEVTGMPKRAAGLTKSFGAEDDGLTAGVHATPAARIAAVSARDVHHLRRVVDELVSLQISRSVLWCR